MPRAARRCARPECDELQPCPTHTPPAWAGRRRTFTRASRAKRSVVLDRDPVCRCPGCPRCTPRGCSRPSTEDDHERNVAAGGNDDLANHAGKCSPCHAWKTQQEAAAGRRRP